MANVDVIRNVVLCGHGSSGKTSLADSFLTLSGAVDGKPNVDDGTSICDFDPEEKAQADQDEFGWNFDLGYGLSEGQMATLGLYVSDPLSPEENDRRFAEPGTYVLRPDGSLLLVATSNGPSARPDLVELLDGMIFTKTNDRPPRGMA